MPTTQKGHLSEQSEHDGRLSPPAEAQRTNVSNLQRTERQAGAHRRETRQQHGEAETFHEQTIRWLLTAKTDEKSKSTVLELLVELTEAHGLGWSDIARLVGVSVPAIRKWRMGGYASADNHVALARLAAFMESLQDAGIGDAAKWLTLPFEGVITSKTDVYRQGNGGAAALLAFAKGDIVRDDVLSKLQIEIRPKSANKVVMAPDGNLSIVPNTEE